MAKAPAPKPKPITKEALLLVEGKDELNFFETLCKHLAFSPQPEIRHFGGVDQFRGFLEVLLDASGFQDVKSIGIIRDAEENAAAALQSVQSSLNNAAASKNNVDLAVPTGPERLVSDGQRAVGVLILPGQGRPGMLETLLCDTLPGKPENACVDAFFKCVKESRQGWTAKRPDKARAQVFITTQPEPHVSVGVAAQKKYWDLNHEALEPVRAFLRSVVAAAN